MEAKDKKLAIKGHPTRGKEVIELLEMMGGKNTYGHNGEMESLYFYINNDNIIHGTSFFNDNYVFFTLEGFLEKYPFKVNDKVIDEADGCPGVVCEMKWDEDVSDMKYCVAFGNGVDFGWFANNSINFFKIKKNENLEENKFPPFEPMFKMNDELEYMVPDGYEITEASKDKVFIKPIKSKYPKTLGDCCKIIVDIGDYQMCGYKHELLFNFQNLLICRDAYWKIAGEQMGLGKPWEPDWLSGRKEEKYCIGTQNNEIWHDFSEYGGNEILAFPTMEMRDAFYENFKDLIEQCKELL
jgi:hypothetical protein